VHDAFDRGVFAVEERAMGLQKVSLIVQEFAFFASVLPDGWG
jgi:hypothetical protein